MVVVLSQPLVLAPVLQGSAFPHRGFFAGPLSPREDTFNGAAWQEDRRAALGGLACGAAYTSRRCSALSSFDLSSFPLVRVKVNPQK